MIATQSPMIVYATRVGQISRTNTSNTPGRIVGYSQHSAKGHFCLGLFREWRFPRLETPFYFSEGSPPHCQEDRRGSRGVHFRLGIWWINVHDDARREPRPLYFCFKVKGKHIIQVIKGATHWRLWSFTFFVFPMTVPISHERSSNHLWKNESEWNMSDQNKLVFFTSDMKWNPLKWDIEV